MLKYHKQIGFKDCHVKEALRLIEVLQLKRIRFSSHSLTELSAEAEAVRIGQFVKDYKLSFDNVFEIAVDNGRIEKLGFRLNFNENDIIFILSREKSIITIWTNKKTDCHKTLKTGLYCKA